MTFVNAVCFSSTQSLTSPEDSARIAMDNLAEVGFHLVEEVSPAYLAGQPAVTYAFERDSTVLREYKFKKDGWLFAVGIRSLRQDAASYKRALRYLSTWEWTPSTVDQG